MSCSQLKVDTCTSPCVPLSIAVWHVRVCTPHVSVRPAPDWCLPRVCASRTRPESSTSSVDTPAHDNVFRRFGRRLGANAGVSRCVTVGLLRHERPPAQRHAHVSISRALPIAAARDQLQRCPLMCLSAQGTISQPRVGRSAVLHGMHTSFMLAQLQNNNVFRSDAT